MVTLAEVARVGQTSASYRWTKQIRARHAEMVRLTESGYKRQVAIFWIAENDSDDQWRVYGIVRGKAMVPPVMGLAKARRVLAHVTRH